MPLYEDKLINPLAVRFSQDRIWPDFQDGRRIEDSLEEIRTVPLQGLGPYDLVLRPPFPPMEIIRLKQEIREADGERARDEKGKRIYGEESWFTFDNRRLYCLQRAALKLWPTVVAVVVKVLFDFPDVRCAKHKFRTTSDGHSVKISLPDGSQGSLWTWQEEARATKSTTESVEILRAVYSDMQKNRKEMLIDPPPQAILDPGSREKTTAERFNLGTHSGPKEGTGKAAGMQLLNLLKGTGNTDDGNTDGQWETANAAEWQWQQHPSEGGWQAEAYGADDYDTQYHEQGYHGNGGGAGGKGYGGGGNRTRRRRGGGKSKGGKGDAGKGA